MSPLTPGTSHEFSVTVLTPNGNPANPLEPAKYKILDSSNTSISEGKMMRGYADGEFAASWSVPSSEIRNPYTLQVMVNAEGFGWVTQIEKFEIEEESQPDFNYIKLITYGRENLTLNVTMAGTFEIAIFGQHDTPLVTLNCDLVIGENTIQASEIKSIPPGMYTVLLTKLKKVGEEDFEVAGDPMVLNFAVAPMRFWTMLPRFRTYLDRYHKDLSRINSYSDEMIYTWFIEGLSKINSVPFLTSWSFNNFPKEPQDAGLVGLWIRCAAYFGLRSQFLLEGELQFDYNGPNVTISRDQTQSIESEIGRLESELANDILEAKKMIKANSIVGVLSHRRPGAISHGRRARIIS